MSDDNKKHVCDVYDAIAVDPSCCPCSQTPEATSRMGYTQEQIDSVPQGAHLGLGCYNPLPADLDLTGKTVLDLGSGAGGDCLLAAARVGPAGRALGVDSSPDMVRRARANAARAGAANVEFRLGEIEHLPVSGGSIDIVISNCVINLCPDKAAVFGEAARVLRPGGLLVVADTVLLRPLPQALRDVPEMYSCCIAGAVPLANYVSLIEQAGLTDVRVEAQQDDLPILDQSDVGAIRADELRGLVASVVVRAHKPA
jgi:SAM-dependent methyltransferase